MQTNSVSLEDFNSKYLQSQERFKSCKPSSKPGPVSFFGLVVFSRPRKYEKYRGWIIGLTKYKGCWCLSEEQTCSMELAIIELD